MQRLRGLIDFLISLWRAREIIVPILGLLVAAVSALAGFWSTVIDVPLPLAIALLALALYPFFKFIEWIVKTRRRVPFPYGGLLWIPSFFSFQYPTPICPIEGCGHKVMYGPGSPRPTPIHGHSPFMEVKIEHVYECPKHGRLRAPDDDMWTLQQKAKQIQDQQRRSKV
jgi:hypothetical protein